MYQPPQRRTVALSLLISALLHLFVIGVTQIFVAEPVARRMFRQRVTAPVPPTRYRQRPSLPVARDLLEQLRTEMAVVESELPGTESVARQFRELDVPQPADRAAAFDFERRPWSPAAGTLAVDPMQAGPAIDLLPLDLVGFAAEGIARTAVIIDGETGKLKQAYLHVPAYGAGLLDPPGVIINPAAGLMSVLELMRRGFRVPEKVPITENVHTTPLGVCGAFDPGKYGLMRMVPDPIHHPTYRRCTGRHILQYQEMIEYPVLLLRVIDVESTQALARYLVAGGIVVGGPINLVYNALRGKLGEQRVQRVRMELGHPVFHSFYDIREYREAQVRGCMCAAVTPVDGLAVDGRLVLLLGPAFNERCPCLSNRLYVNVLAYALIQPSPMGVRYVDR
jgi:hypothetical protein